MSGQSITEIDVKFSPKAKSPSPKSAAAALAAAALAAPSKKKKARRTSGAKSAIKKSPSSSGAKKRRNNASGLLIPIAGVRHHLRVRHPRISAEAALAATAGAEFLIEEVIHATLNIAAEQKHSRLTSRQIFLALAGDYYLSRAVSPGESIIPESGNLATVDKNKKAEKKRRRASAAAS